MTYEGSDLRVTADGATLLDEVTVQVGAGEIVAIIGPNGAGKSTLVRALAGDLTPDTGTVELDGQPLSRWTPAELARQRAVMAGDRPIAFAFTASEVALLGRSPHHGGHPTDADRAIVEELLVVLDCARLGDRLHASLSSGERQRVQLARALAQVTSTPSEDTSAPTYLLLDEPTSSLDPAHQHRAMRLLRDRAERGLGVLVVLHDLDLAAAYADRIVVMKDARVVDMGSPAEVMRAESLEAVFELPMLVIPHPRLSHPLVVPDVGQHRREAPLSSSPAEDTQE
jgi:iron complex transport system ATP-binding protein